MPFRNTVNLVSGRLDHFTERICRDAVFCGIYTNLRGRHPLFFGSPYHRNSRFSAVEAMSFADNFL
jgi:hypothetical protein